MGKLYFRVASDWEEVVKLRNEIEKLKQTLLSMDKNRTPAAVAALEVQLGTARKKMDGLVISAAKAGAVMENDLKKGLFNASQTVNGFTERIIAQKAVVKDVEADVRRLGDSYRTALRRKPLSASGKLDEYNAARKVLEEEKASLFDLTQQQATARLSVSKLRQEYSLYKNDSTGVVEANNGIVVSWKKALAIVGGVSMIKSLVSDVTQVRMEIDSVTKSFEALLKSEGKAKDMIGGLKELSIKSGLNTYGAAQTLLGFNVDAEKIIPSLKSIGDITMGNNEKFSSMTLAFAQMSAAGRLMGQDLNQMINAGFNPLQIISEKTGKSIAVLKKEMEQGVISSEMVADAFATATAEGGRFYNMLEKQNTGIRGEKNKQIAVLKEKLNEIGKANEDIIAGSYRVTTKMIENYEAIGKVIAGLVATYGTYRTAIMLVTAAESKHTLVEIGLTNVRVLARKAQLALNASMLTNPYVLLAVAVTALGTAMWAMSDGTTAAARAQKEYNDIKDVASKKEQDHKQKIEELLTSVRDESLATLIRQKSLEELRKEYPKIFEKYDLEKLKLSDILKLKQLINEEDSKRSVQGRKDNYTSLKQTFFNQQRYLELFDNPELRKNMSDKDMDIWKMFAGTQSYVQVREQMEKNSELLKKYQKDVLDDNIASYKANLKNYSKEKLEAELKMAQSSASKRNGFNVGGMMVKSGDLENVISSINGALAEKKNPSTYKHDYEEAKKEWEKAKKALLEIEKDKDKFTSRQYKKAKEDVDSTEKLYKDLGGVTKERKPDIDKNRKEQAKLTEEIKKSAQERKDLLIQSELDIQQQQIDLLDEGSEKELAQIQLNYDRKYQEITKRERELLQKMQDEERKQWEIDNPKFKEKNLHFVPKITSLTPEQRTQYDKEYSLAFQKQEKDTQALLNKLLEKYRDYEAQKTAIEKEGNTEIAYLQSKRTDANAEEIDRAIAVAKQKMKEGIQQIDDTRAEATAKDNPFLRNLFGDTSQMAFKDLQNLIDQAKQLRSYLSGTGDSKGITFIDAEQLKVIEKSPAELDKLKKALDNLLKGSKSNEWDDILKGFDKGLAKIKSAKGFKEFSEGMQDIGESASKASDMISGVSGDLSSMFEAMGDTEAADAMSGVQDAMNSISNIGQGFAKGGIVGGIAAAVGEAANFIGKAFAANARHKAALKEIMNEAIAQQREYNLLLMQQNLEYEKATTIFGTDTYGKAANGVNVMKEAISDLNDELRGTSQQRNNQSRDAFLKKFFGVNNPQVELKKAYAGLAEIEIKTGHKKTGLFGWGKGKDVYSSILDVYPQLINSSGKFDKSLAETIIKTRTMSDESKSALQNMIDLAQQAEDAYKELKDYMTDIFGDLGNSMTDALVNAFVNGTDAAQAFTDSVSNMLETLAKQMVYSVTLAPIIEKAQSQMMEVMKNTGLSDEQKFNKWTGVLDGLVGDAINQQELANRLMKEYQQAAKDKGFDILNSSSSSSSSSKSGTMQMTQEEGRELNGRFTALQIAGEEIKAENKAQSKHFETLVAATYEHIVISSDTRNIADDIRDIQAKSYLELVEIRDNTGETVKQLKSVNERLGKIETNTNGL